VRPESASSVGDSLSQRYNKADNNNVDLFVSLHANAGGGVGTEVFTYNAKEIPEAREVLIYVLLDLLTEALRMVQVFM
jgi:N-acetylmuramoyl-L-alanine amidase